MSPTMKQDDRQDELPEDDLDIEVTSMDDMTEDIVEAFARQLDEVVRIQDEEEEEEEDYSDNFGYQQLAQDEDDDEMYQQLQSDDEEEETKERLEIDVDASERLNPETSDLIKSIMANIQLSNDAVPDWAKTIPESAWLPRINPKD